MTNGLEELKFTKDFGFGYGCEKLSDISVAQIGFALVIFGFILALVAVILLAIRSKTGGSKTRGGAVLFIGPIPIIFGTDRESAKILVALAIVLMAVVLVFMLLPSLLTR